MKLVYTLLLSTLSLLMSANTHAAGSTLNVICKGDDIGADVLIDGKFKGTCPLDVKVRPGKLKLTVLMKSNFLGNRIFEQEIRIGDDVTKKIDVTLSVLQPKDNSQTQDVTNASSKLGADGKRCLECPAMAVIPGTNFAMAKYTVTFDEWDACVLDGGCNGYRPSDKEWGRGTRPVMNVSWLAAQGYIKWLNKKTGNTYRLPTEEEWEFAARAGTTTPYYWGIFPFGDSASSINANCYGCGSKWDNRTTSPVGSFKPNSFGLYDMSGNVWQWTDSCWEGDCSKRVLRGGSWNETADHIKVDTRFRDDTKGYNHDTGFRLVRTLK
ncbi:MAG: SUMF1/EgtB/PvdO family nonheme iron enzyme [Candidatus Nitrotoga sp.]